MSATLTSVAGLTAAGTGSNSSSGGGIGFLVISLLAVGAFVILIKRSGKRRAGYAQQVQSAAASGSEVMTSGGIFGTVVGGDDEQVLLEIAPGVQVRFARAAIARVLAPEDPLSQQLPDGTDRGLGDGQAAPRSESGDDPDGPPGDARS